MSKSNPLDTHNHRKEDLPKIETSLNLTAEKLSLLDTEKHNLAELKEKLENFKRDLPALKEDFSKISLKEKGKRVEAKRDTIYKGITELKHGVDALLKEVLSLSVDISALEAAQSEALSGAESEVVPPVVETAAENLPVAGAEFLYGTEKIKVVEVKDERVFYEGLGLEKKQDFRKLPIEKWNDAVAKGEIQPVESGREDLTPGTEYLYKGNIFKILKVENGNIIFKNIENSGKESMLLKLWQKGIEKGTIKLLAVVESEPEGEEVAPDAPLSSVETGKTFEEKREILRDHFSTTFLKDKRRFKKGVLELNVKKDRYTAFSKYLEEDVKVSSYYKKLGITLDDMKRVYTELAEEWKAEDKAEREARKPVRTKLVETPASGSAPADLPVPAGEGPLEGAGSFIADGSPDASGEIVPIPEVPDGEPAGSSVIRAVNVGSILGGENTEGEGETPETPEEKKNKAIDVWLQPGDFSEFGRVKFGGSDWEIGEFLYYISRLDNLGQKLVEASVTQEDIKKRVEFLARNVWWKDVDPDELDFVLSTDADTRKRASLRSFDTREADDPEKQKTERMQAWLTEKGFVPGEKIIVQKGKYVVERSPTELIPLSIFLKNFEDKRWFKEKFGEKEFDEMQKLGIRSEDLIACMFRKAGWDKKVLRKTLSRDGFRRIASRLEDAPAADASSDASSDAGVDATGDDSSDSLEANAEQKKTFIHDWLQENDFVPGKRSKLVENTRGYSIIDEKIGTQLTLSRFLDQFAASYQKEMKSLFAVGIGSEDILREWFTLESWDKEKLQRSLDGTRWERLLVVSGVDDDDVSGPVSVLGGRTAHGHDGLPDGDDDTSDRTAAHDRSGDTTGAENTLDVDVEVEPFENFEFDGKPIKIGDRFKLEFKRGSRNVEHEFIISRFVVRDGEKCIDVIFPGNDHNQLFTLDQWQGWQSRGVLTKVDTHEIDPALSRNFEFEGNPVVSGDRFSMDPRDGGPAFDIVVGDFVVRGSQLFLEIQSLATGVKQNFTHEDWQRWVDNNFLTKIDTSDDTEAADSLDPDRTELSAGLPDVDADLPEMDVEDADDVIEFGGREFVAGDELFLVIPRLPVQKVTVVGFDEDDQVLVVRNEKGNTVRIKEEHLEFLKEDLDTDKTGVFRPLDRRQLPPELPVEGASRSQEAEANLPFVDRLKHGLGAENLKNYYTKFALDSQEHISGADAIWNFIKNLPDSKFSPEKKLEMVRAIHTALGSMFAGAHKRYLHLHEHYDETEAPVEEAPPTPETFAGRFWGKAMDIGKSIKRQAKEILISGAAAAGVGAGTGLGVGAAVTTVSGIGATGAMVAAFAPVFMAGAGAIAAKGVWDYLKRGQWQETKEKRMNVSPDEQKKIEGDTWKKFEVNEASLAADRVALTIEAALAGMTDPTEIQQYVYDGLLARTEHRVYADPNSSEARADSQRVKLEKKSWERDQLISPELAYTALAQNFTNRSDFFTHNWGLLGKGYESVAGGDFGTLSENKQKALAGGFLSSIVAGTSAMVVVMSGGGLGSKLLGRAATGFGFGTFRGMAGHKSENIISESKRMREADVRLHRGDETQKQNLDARIDNIQLNNKNRAADSLAKGLYGAALGVGLGAAADKGAEMIFGHRGVFEEGTQITHGPNVAQVEEIPVPQPEVLAPAVHFAPGETININGHEFHIGPQQELVELPKVLSVDSAGNTLLGTTTIVSHSGAEWGALDRLSDQYGNFGMTKGQEAAWIKDELAQYGFVFRGGNVGRPWEVHPGMKVEVFVDKVGHPHIKFLGQEGKDFTAFKFLKFQEPAKITHTETTIIPPATPEKMPVNVKEVYDGIYNGKINVPESTHVEMHKVAALPEVHTEMVSGPGAAHETYLAREGGKSYVYIKQPDGAFMRSSYDDFFKAIPNANKVSHLPGDMHSDLRGIAREQSEHAADKARLTPELPPQPAVETKQVTTLDPTKKVWVSSNTPVRAANAVEEKSSFVPVSESLHLPEKVGEIQSYRDIVNMLEKVNTGGPGAEERCEELLISAFKQQVGQDQPVSMSAFKNIEDKILLARLDQNTRPFVVGNPPSHAIKILKDGEAYFLRDDEAVFSKNIHNEPVMIFHNADGTDSSYVVKDFHPQMDLSVQYIVEIDGVLRPINPRQPLAS